MATTGIWKICSSLSQVIKYTINEEKTDINNYRGLDKSLEYIKDDFKTEKKLFVDGINCNSNNALNEMVAVKKRYMKTDGILGWHAYHSYKSGEITPELAHEVGMKVATEMWGDRFQVVVSTHVNGKCIHNHFVINSVSFVDGKKYYGNRTTYAELRRISNAICSEYGLSTLEEKKTKSGINYLNYQNKSLVYTNYYKIAKEDLDIAISKASTYQEFINILKKMGYETTTRAGKLSIKGKMYKRNIRIERYFGNDYSIENIQKQIKGIYVSTTRTYYRNKKPIDSSLKILLKPKYNTFYGMYVRYCKLLGNYPDYVKKNNKITNLRKDVDKLEQLSKQAIFLVDNKIETEEQFYNLLKTKENELDTLKNEREDLWKKHKYAPSIEKEKIKKQISKLSDDIIAISKDIKMCEDIRVRKNKVMENINILDEKEMVNNERFK